MTMNPFEQSTQQLLRFLTSHAEWEVIDYIRQIPAGNCQIEPGEIPVLRTAPGVVHSAKEFIQLFRPDEQEDTP